MSARDLQNPELGSCSGATSNSTSRIDNKPLGPNVNIKTESPVQQAPQGLQRGAEEIGPMDTKGDAKVYARRHTSQTANCQASTHLGKRERDAQTCRDIKPDDQKLSRLNVTAAVGSTSYAARSATRLSTSSQASGSGGTDETKCPPRQAQDFIYMEPVRPKLHDGTETSHKWIFGAVAELLDNAVDEVPHGATKVLIDSVVNPQNGSLSLLVQDDGGGMDPISLWKCMTAACPNTKPPGSIGQNGTGFKAAISCLGAGAIVFSRHVHTSSPTQSIGLRFHASGSGGEETDKKHIIIPMVNYKYDPVTAEIIRYERKPGQFHANMSMLLSLSPYNSEEELLQNFNDIGPHGTKIIVFNLSRNTRGDLDLDFNTHTEDIKISAVTMHAENKSVGDQNHLVHQYRRSLRAYVSILYMGLPKHFRIILRGQEVKRRNLVTELKDSQYIRYRRSTTEREDEVVLGFLEEAADVEEDRFCFYYKQRLILPFVPAYGFSNRNQSIVGVLQPNHLKPARNKQDFQWSQDLEALQKILKEMGREFWKQRKGNELKDFASQLSLAPPGSHNEADLIGNNTTVMHSQMTASAPTHLASTIVESSSRGMPSNMVPKAPAPCLPLFPTTPTGDEQKRVMDMADSWDQGNTFNGVPPRHPTTLPWWNSGTSSHGTGSVPFSQLPISVIASMAASMAGDGHRQTTPAVARTNVYGMNINGASTSTAPWPAYLVPPFSQPNSTSVGSNGVMRVPAPHPAAVYTPATLASSLTGTALPLPETQAATPNNNGSLAPSNSAPAGAMVALHDLPIEMEHDGAYDDIAILPSVSLTAPTAGAEATSATATPTLTMTDTRHQRASAFRPWSPSGFNLVDSSSSSRQAQELQGDSNQGEQGAKPLLDLFKP